MHIDTFFFYAFTFPAQFDAYFLEGKGGKLADGMHFACGYHEVFRCIVLKNQPHTFYIIFRISPVATCIQITQIQFVLETLGYAGGGQRNLTGYECFSSTFAFVIEKDTVYGKHTITFAVVLCNPEAVLFGYSVRAAGIERSCFRLGDFLYFTVKFRSGGLVNLCLFLHAEDADSFQHTQRADGICLCGVFRYVERYFYMALCSEVIYFVRLYLLDDADQRAAVRHVTVMQVNGALLLHVAYPFVEVQMFDAPCIE